MGILIVLYMNIMEVKDSIPCETASAMKSKQNGELYLVYF
jgi:hypothetical protein